MGKMTIHRALAELKIIDARIAKAIDNIDPVGLMQKNMLVNKRYNKESFETNAKAQYQSAIDLINRKMLIKSAIVKANGNTMVEVAGMKITIADAINYKNIIAVRESMIAKLESNYKQAIGRLETENESVHATALKNAQIMLGKAGDEKIKPTDKDVANIMGPFIERHELHLVNPLDLPNLTKKLQDEVDSFETEIDAVLSESNAITVIEI